MQLTLGYIDPEHAVFIGLFQRHCLVGFEVNPVNAEVHFLVKARDLFLGLIRQQLAAIRHQQDNA